MVHTANLMASGGMASEFPNGDIRVDGPSAKAVRPVARKSQIIEEEEDAEDEYEEVDTFTGTEEEPASPVGVNGSELPGMDDLRGRSPPVLKPAPDLDSSPLRPPRSSSLRATSLDPIVGSIHLDKADLNTSPKSVASGKRSLGPSSEENATAK
jgi:hypothetical protein